ncbi:MAG: hypothetical protein Q9211_004058 [Gyalolechia sp. 1 TL-2023]
MIWLLFVSSTAATLLLLKYLYNNDEHFLSICIALAANVGAGTCVVAREAFPRIFASDGNNSATPEISDHDLELGVNAEQ